MNFYPLEFIPISKQTIWGGEQLNKEFNKNFKDSNVGESWELSCVQKNISIIKNGGFAGQDLETVLKKFPEEILGKKVFKYSGADLPLLFKFIDAAQNLSVQVHPNDEIAKKRHNSFGKTEMWFVLSAQKGSKILCGFKERVDKNDYENLIESGKIIDVLASYEVSAGDAFFIPAGTVHAIGSGITVAEIQQTSDITYRIFDYNRKDAQGNKRQLHIKEAFDVIDFTPEKNCKIQYQQEKNKAVNIVKCDYFTVNNVLLEGSIKRNLQSNDSFIVYMCVEGSANIFCGANSINILKGRTILIPSIIANDIEMSAKSCRLLEVYI
jgi:mannose-6-phosphate isomerase